jgi:hypothetical protein
MAYMCILITYIGKLNVFLMHYLRIFNAYHVFIIHYLNIFDLFFCIFDTLVAYFNTYYIFVIHVTYFKTYVYI